MTNTPKPQANTQEKLRDFIRDPKNIAKAVEGSMDKRNAVIDQANTLDEKLISMFNDLTEEQFVVRMNDLITEARVEQVKKPILEYHANKLDGKGYDFFFSLNMELDRLTQLKENK